MCGVNPTYFFLSDGVGHTVTKEKRYQKDIFCHIFFSLAQNSYILVSLDAEGHSLSNDTSTISIPARKAEICNLPSPYR